MRTGRNLTQLAEELVRRAAAKKDLVADTRHIRFDKSCVYVDASESFALTPLAHRQIAEHTGIPVKYYEAMRVDAPELLQRNVRHWFDNNPARRMLRVLDGQARAFLSDRYRRIDNEQVADAALKALHQRNLATVESCEVTDSRLYIKALFPNTEQEVKPGDVVQAGVVISNSEVGLGALSVQLMVFRLVCSNGLIRGSALRQSHIGGRVEARDGIAYRDETIAVDDKALLMKLEDSIASIAGSYYAETVNEMRISADVPAVLSPTKAVEVLGKSYGLSLVEQTSVLENLIRGQDYTRWGVINAVTATAEKAESYDRATELEALGGALLGSSTAANWAPLLAAA